MTAFWPKLQSSVTLWSSLNAARLASTTRVTALYRRARFFAIDACPSPRCERKSTFGAPGLIVRITAPDNGNGLADACKIVTANGMIGCPNCAAARSEPIRSDSLQAPFPSVEYASVTVYSAASLRCDVYLP